MNSEPRDECKRCFGPMQNANGTPVCIWCDYDREPPPTPAAAPHAAPREGEPETIYGMLDRYTTAVRDAALAEFNVGPEDAGGDPDIDRAYETVHRMRAAIRAALASQQAALDAARKALREILTLHPGYEGDQMEETAQRALDALEALDAPRSEPGR